MDGCVKLEDAQLCTTLKALNTFCRSWYVQSQLSSRLCLFSPVSPCDNAVREKQCVIAFSLCRVLIFVTAFVALFFVNCVVTF